VPLNPTKPT